MTLKLLFISFIVLAFSLNANAQRVIALVHNGSSTFFTDIPAAISVALDGDTIYLPGGSFPAFNIDKKLTIVGAGHNPDATEATSSTIINGSIFLTSSASYTFISGIKILGNFVFNIYTSNITIQRCNMQGGVIFQGGNNNGLIFQENIFGQGCNTNFPSYLPVSICGGGGSGVFTNNIFLFGIQNPIQNTSFRNNIFFTFNSALNATDCLFENNIANPFYAPTNNCTFSNNINLGINGNDDNGNNGDENILNIDFNSLFTQFTDPWDYTDDFHFINSSYNTGGTDGTPIGIYGGLSPWKEGSVPFNPHIESKQISSTTDPSGNLNVNIQVEAQDN